MHAAGGVVAQPSTHRACHSASPHQSLILDHSSPRSGAPLGALVPGLCVHRVSLWDNPVCGVRPEAATADLPWVDLRWCVCTAVICFTLCWMKSVSALKTWVCEQLRHAANDPVVASLPHSLHSHSATGPMGWGWG